jgi:hypothetical protein
MRRSLRFMVCDPGKAKPRSRVAELLATGQVIAVSLVNLDSSVFKE